MYFTSCLHVRSRQLRSTQLSAFRRGFQTGMSREAFFKRKQKQKCLQPNRKPGMRSFALRWEKLGRELQLQLKCRHALCDAREQQERNDVFNAFVDRGAYVF